MADLGKTQAQWNTLAGEVLGGLVLAVLLDLEATARRLFDERERAVARVLPSAFVNGLPTVSGADPGTNLTPGALGYVRIVDNGGGVSFTVSVYKATGGVGGDLVMQGSAAPGVTAILAAQNGSGLTGTWPLPATVSATSDDTLVLDVRMDYPLRAARVLASAGGDDLHARGVLSDAYKVAANGLRSEVVRLLGQLRRALLTDGAANPRALLAEFLARDYTQFATESRTPDEDDNVDRQRRGAIAAGLLLAMEDETTAGEQFVVRRVPAAAAAVFDARNDGLGSVAAHTPLEFARECTLVAECTSDELGDETFGGTITITDDGREQRLSFAGWKVGKTFTFPNGLGPAELVRAYSKTGDATGVNLAPATGATAPTVSGENSTNTSDGDLGWKVVQNADGTTWDYSFYRSTTSLLDANLVAKATGVATGANFVAKTQNGSGLSVSWKSGTAPVTTTEGTLSLNPFKLSRDADGLPDSFSIAVTVAAGPGLFQTLLSTFFAAHVNSAASGLETIGDAWARQGNYPYDELDY